MASATEVVVSNCGDSRAVLCRNRCAIDLSRDHKPFQPDEKARIEGFGYVRGKRERVKLSVEVELNFFNRGWVEEVEVLSILPRFLFFVFCFLFFVFCFLFFVFCFLKYYFDSRRYSTAISIGTRFRYTGRNRREFSWVGQGVPRERSAGYE